MRTNPRNVVRPALGENRLSSNDTVDTLLIYPLKTVLTIPVLVPGEETHRPHSMERKMHGERVTMKLIDELIGDARPVRIAKCQVLKVPNNIRKYREHSVQAVQKSVYDR